MMRQVIFLVIFCACLASGVHASVTTFEFHGTWDDNTTASGTFTVDTTAGIVLNADFLYLGQSYSTILTQYPFDCCSDPNSLPISYNFFVGVSSQNFPAIRLGLPGTIARDSLVGYVGGVCTEDIPCGPDSDGNTWASGYWNINGVGMGLVSGSAAPVPEASSLVILGSGVLGLAGVLRRKLMR
jgi:hypothetical protein